MAVLFLDWTGTVPSAMEFFLDMVGKFLTTSIFCLFVLFGVVSCCLLLYELVLLNQNLQYPTPYFLGVAQYCAALRSSKLAAAPTHCGKKGGGRGCCAGGVHGLGCRPHGRGVRIPIVEALFFRGREGRGE